jgi:DNA-binding LacI/PurR family transcriptional regulator
VPPERSPGVFANLKDMRIPFVLVDRFFPKGDFSSIRVDDKAAGMLATRCLIDLGHTRIAHIQGSDVSPGSLRRRGYLAALKAAGIPSERDYIVVGNFELESGREAMRKLLELKLRPTAVFAANDPMALGAVYACRDAGLQVPRDISIVGAGNIEGPHHPNPFLTTIDWPRQELGRIAAGMLLEAIENPGQPAPPSKVLQPRLLIRQSTAKPG